MEAFFSISSCFELSAFFYIVLKLLLFQSLSIYCKLFQFVLVQIPSIWYCKHFLHSFFVKDISNLIFLDLFSSILHPLFILGTSLLVKFLFNFCFAFAVIGRHPPGAPEGNHTCRVITKAAPEWYHCRAGDTEFSQPSAQEIRNWEMLKVSKLEQQRHWASFF